jgi:catechol 2,3-dioxygenase-like lactoylglutathione lyase family enzyme
MSIAIVSVPVTDQSAAKAFYTGIMAFEEKADEPMGPDMRWVQLQPKTGGSSIALVTWFEGLQPGGQQGLLLHVPDIDAEHARLADLGVQVSPIEEQHWGRFTLLKDPDGNGWVVAQLSRPQDIVTRRT